MLTKLMVDIYAWLVELALWFLLLVSGVAGYHFTVPVLNAGGLIPSHPMAWPSFGAVAFAWATFLVSAVLAGPFLVLVDIRKSVKALELRHRDAGHPSPDLRELREPSL